MTAAAGPTVPGPSRRTVVRPTAFGVTSTAVAAAVLAARSSIHDPTLAGLVWTVFAALVVIGMVWPLVVMRLVRVTVHEVARDGVVGRTMPLGVTVRCPGLVDTVALLVEGTTDTTWWSASSGVTDLEVAMRRRGLLRSIVVVVSSDGPLGMLTVTRRLVVPLAHPLAIGPQPVPRHWSPPHAPEAGPDDGPNASTAGGDQVRSVRPYRSGDPAHLVHWPSSARVGSLVVRELEPPIRPGVVLILDLGPASGGASTEWETAVERAVSEAGGLAAAVLRNGGGLVLCSCDDGVARAAEVTTALQLQRRLAAAGPGPVGVAPRGGEWATVVVEPSVVS